MWFKHGLKGQTLRKIWKLQIFSVSLQKIVRRSAIRKQAFIALAGIIFAEEAILFNHEDMTFLDMALPIHNFTYIQAYRAKSVKLRQPSWYLLIHPSHNIHHFFVYHLNFIEIPTNCFIMIYPIAQATEFV